MIDAEKRRCGPGARGLDPNNQNGRSTCKEARRHGIAPVRRSHPAYRYLRDARGVGVVCEGPFLDICSPNEEFAAGPRFRDQGCVRQKVTCGFVRQVHREF